MRKILKILWSHAFISGGCFIGGMWAYTCDYVDFSILLGCFSIINGWISIFKEEIK